MMKFFKIFGILVLSSFSLLAQEKLMPLSGNLQLINYDYSQQNNLSQKTASVTSDTLPFFDDFYYAPNSPFPTISHWVDSSVYINTGFAIAPPSIGVATFDGLNKNGYPYNIAATSIVSASADFLTSKPINLYKQGTKIYSPADSIGFTFLYQSRGFGDNPEIDDSLIVEFFKPLVPPVTGTVVGKWVKAWGTRGVNSPVTGDSTFKRAFVRITDTAYFHDGFRLRFRNKATTSGSLDHWHVDYVNLKQNYFKTDTVYRDVAFGYMPRPFLKNYSEMPYKQYTATEMGTKFSNFIRNNDTVAKNGIYQYTICTASSATLDVFNGGSQKIVRFNPRGWDSIPTHRNPPIAYTIPTQTATSNFLIKHAVNTSPDDWRYNDTVIQKLSFDNYYAYDDGSAEQGYYLNTFGAKTALRYTTNVQDTLQALDIFFDPIKEGNLLVSSGFRMCIWDAGPGQPGTLLLRDSVMYPKFLQIGYNKIPRYALTTPLVLSPGTYYFGLQQITAIGLNIGFDRNINHSDALYYDIGGFWQQSTIAGSLMIHPVFGRASFAIGIKENFTAIDNSYLNLYPNPASDVLYVQNKSQDANGIFTLEIYSTLGQKVKELQLNQSLSEIKTDDLTSGLYFVVLKNNSDIVSQQKLIISK